MGLKKNNTINSIETVEERESYLFLNDLKATVEEAIYELEINSSNVSNMLLNIILTNQYNKIYTQNLNYKR
jgi:hypothetical protein